MVACVIDIGMRMHGKGMHQDARVWQVTTLAVTWTELLTLPGSLSDFGNRREK